LRYGRKTERNLDGIWLTQFRYPSGKSGEEKTETQIVQFKQHKNLVRGRAIYADSHPDVIEGLITSNRYFTGVYCNTINYHNYHGAFQFVISNSKQRMMGKWVGFDRVGADIGHGAWRWEQYSTSTKCSDADLQKLREIARKADLFCDETFQM
jgi:hypothetical protein